MMRKCLLLWDGEKEYAGKGMTSLWKLHYVFTCGMSTLLTSGVHTFISMIFRRMHACEHNDSTILIVLHHLGFGEMVTQKPAEENYKKKHTSQCRRCQIIIKLSSSSSCISCILLEHEQFDDKGKRNSGRS